MDLNQLETFLAVAEERSFSRAAVRLHRSQPAVSQVIRKLESDLDEVLFERASRDGALTAAGELLREYAAKLLNLRNEAANALEQLRSLERGRLNLAANEYTCLYLLPVLDEFRRLCPQITVSVQRSLASRIPDELLKRSVEIGIVSFRPDNADFRSIVVYSDDLAFVVNPKHPLARRKNISIRDLGAENFIAHNVPSPLRRQVIEAFRRHKTPLNMGVELPTIEAIKRFVAMGNGVALVPGLTIQREVQSGELARIHVKELQIRRQLRLIHRKSSSLSHAAVAFLKIVHSAAVRHGAPFQYHVERSS
jgi:DNA-binding transcriptional LysR family regulator